MREGGCERQEQQRQQKPKSILFFFFFNNFIYLSLAVLGFRCQVGFSLVAVIGGYSLVAVQRLLIVVTSLIEEHGL